MILAAGESAFLTALFPSIVVLAITIGVTMMNTSFRSLRHSDEKVATEFQEFKTMLQTQLQQNALDHHQLQAQWALEVSRFQEQCARQHTHFATTLAVLISQQQMMAQVIMMNLPPEVLKVMTNSMPVSHWDSDPVPTIS